MQPERPSITALGVAAIRAAHQRLEGGRVFADPLAARILGSDAEDPQLEVSFHPDAKAARMVVAARARFIEDALAAAVENGVRQVVVLGAGLDTFAYRNPHAGIRVFEVDVPATQEWKRERLTEAGIAVPPSVTFAPVELGRTSLPDGLAAAGLDAAAPTFFSCAGLVPYLTPEAVSGLLGFVATFPAGSGMAFDHADPPGLLPPEERAAYDARAAWAAANGEPFLFFSTPQDLAAQIRDLGLGVVEYLDHGRLVSRYEPFELPGESRFNYVVHIARPTG
jgi:methyltransferase (TIGR00027 family)